MTYDGYTKYDARVSESYEDDRRKEDHWQAEQQFMAEHVARHRLGRVLDLPVGTGRFFEYYREADSVCGVDISTHMLEVARRKASQLQVPRLELQKGDVVALPYADASFDTVVCFRLMHLLPPGVMERAFAELARVSAGPVLVQVYANADHGAGSSIARGARSLARTVYRRLMRKQSTPWSHIQSYGHSARSLLTAADNAELRLLRRHSLGSYGNSSVEVLEISR